MAHVKKFVIYAHRTTHVELYLWGRSLKAVRQFRDKHYPGSDVKRFVKHNKRSLS